MRTNHRSAKERKSEQVNVRFTATELQALERVAQSEDRDYSYLVAWFVRWGIEHYDRVGSLMALRNTKIVTEVQKSVMAEVREQADKRLKIREEASSDGKSNGPDQHVRKKNAGA